MLNKIRSYFTKKLILSKPYFDISKIERYMSNKIIYIKKNDNSYCPCLFIEDNNNCNKFLIIFHDKDEDIFSCQKEYELLREELKFNLIIVEYPEYSICFNNDKDCESILKDSLLVYDYIKMRFKVMDEDIYVFGKGLGSTPAIFLSYQRKVGALFLINGFANLRDLSILPPFLNSIFFENIFENLECIDKVKSPTLFIHGRKNALIFYKDSSILYDKCSSIIKEIFIFSEMTHNIINLKDEVLNPIKQFLHKNNITPNIINNYYNLDEEEYKDLFIIPQSIIEKIKRYLIEKKEPFEYKDDDFSNLELIRSGAFGDIYKAKNKKDKNNVCLKKINIQRMKYNYSENEIKHYEKDLNNEIFIL